VKVHCDLEFVTGMSIPWREFGTREECVAFFLEQARAFFEQEKRLKKHQAQYRRTVALRSPAGPARPHRISLSAVTTTVRPR
jgi:hypothetical protein